MPSTSAGVSPASSRAALIAWQARESSLPARPLANACGPTPAIAVWSLMVTALPAFELRRAALDEGHHSFLGVLGAADQLLGEALVPEGGDAVGVEGPVGEPLGKGNCLGWGGGRAAGQVDEGLLHFRAGDDRGGQPAAVGLGRRH